MKIFTLFIVLLITSVVQSQTFDWTPQSSGVTESLNDVYFTDNFTGWAVGNKGVIIHTTDGGQNWTVQTSGTTENLKAVFFIDGNTGWAAGGSTKKTMLKTIDGGSSWQDISSNNIPNRVMYDIAFANADRGWVLSYDSIYITSDGGDTWENEKYGPIGDASPNARSLVVTSDTTAYVGGSIKKSTSSRQAVVFYRNNESSPATWDISPFNVSTTDDEFGALAFAGFDIGFAGGKLGKIYRKSGAGDLKPWDLNLDLSADGVTTISSLSFPDDKRGMFCFWKDVSGTNTVFIYHTSDTGDSWTSTPDDIPDFSSPFLCATDVDHAWIVGFGGKVFKGIRKTSGIKPLSFEGDISIYPNPVNNVINVNINIRESKTINYSLLDITGRTVKQGTWNVNPAGSRFGIDVSGQLKGVYLLSLSTNKGRSAFRILKY